MGTGKNRHWSMEPAKSYGGKQISNKYVFSLFINCWRSYIECTFANIELFLGTKVVE